MKLQRLKIARVKAGLRQEELAELSGIHRVTIGRIEQGGNTSLQTASRLARVLNVDETALWEDEL